LEKANSEFIYNSDNTSNMIRYFIFTK